MIAIIDYDIGNLGAVASMLHRLGISCCISGDAREIETAERLILPGNGAFDACMQGLRGSGLLPTIERRVLRDGTPLLGICVGAQMLGTGSEEGREVGLGWLPMRSVRFPTLRGLRVPHMGWNAVWASETMGRRSTLFDGEARFYFVHSYYMVPEQSSDVLLWARYGVDFAAAVCRGHIVGVQFHPEKSHRYGKQLLAQFARGAL